MGTRRKTRRYAPGKGYCKHCGFVQEASGPNFRCHRCASKLCRIDVTEQTRAFRPDLLEWNGIMLLDTGEMVDKTTGEILTGVLTSEPLIHKDYRSGLLSRTREE